jgi:hypothetical protein
MNAKPRVFLGSSGAQAAMIEALTVGLSDIATVEPWTTSFAPGSSTLQRLVELSHEVDFAVFVFAADDWTSTDPAADSAQASPRDNVVFEAGLFGGVIGMPRSFILHARGSKLPTDLLGLTAVRYDGADADAELPAIVQKLRDAILAQGSQSRIEGLWWQHSLTARSEREPSAVSLLRIARDRFGCLEVAGRSWQENGTLSARYWSEASKELREPQGIFYYWKGERPRDPDAPQLEGTGQISIDSADRADGFFTTRSESQGIHARTSGVYLRADAGDLAVLDGPDAARRAALITEQLERWKALSS